MTFIRFRLINGSQVAIQNLKLKTQNSKQPMAYEPKTKPTQIPVSEFIENIENDIKRSDAQELVGIFQDVTGFEPYMFGPTIIGFGNYHYKYASGHEGDAPLSGFSPRKTALTFYFEPEFPEKEELLSRLGKHKVSKGCVYANKLADIDIAILKQLIVASTTQTKKLYP